MKKAMMAVSALSVVFALLISASAAGINDGEEPEQEAGFEEMRSEYGDTLDEVVGDIGKEGNLNETEDRAPRFSKFVKRSYEHMTTGFNKRNSMWGHLPPVKNIHGTDDPGQWMVDYIEEHGEEPYINVTDDDEDGIPEKVVIHRRYPDSKVNNSEEIFQEVDGETKDALTNAEVSLRDENSTSVLRKGGYRFVYVDSDDDGNPESIALMMVVKVSTVTDSSSSPAVHYSFFWSGRALDRDDDGDWDMETYRTMTSYRMDRNNDGIPERRHHHRASYLRIDAKGRSNWDLIKASSFKGKLMDSNSDGAPEKVHVASFNGIWLDRNGDMWPEMIKMRASVKEAEDLDSDGNIEVKDLKHLVVRYMDKNSDKDPELVNLVYKRKTAFDRDDDGKVDVIRTVSKVFTWIDRNSDGIPELVTRSSNETYHRPRDKGDNSSLRERVKERVKKAREDRDDDPEDRPERERPRRPDQDEDEPSKDDEKATPGRDGKL